MNNNTVNLKMEASYLNLEMLKISNDVSPTHNLSMKWGFRNNFPRITVYSYENGKNNARAGIVAPFTLMGMNTFLGGLEKIIDAPNDSKFKVDCLNNEWKDNAKTGNVIVQATVTFGKDADGVLYFNIANPSKPVVSRTNFELLPDSKFFKFYKGDEEITSKSVLSKLTASSYVKTIRDMLLKYGDMNKLINPANRNAVTRNTPVTEPIVVTNPDVAAAANESKLF